jgi:EpsI family protein
MLAGLLLLASGAASRVIDSELRRPVSDTGPPQFAQVPLEFGPWRGVDVPLEASIVQTADADSFLCRRYVNAARRTAVTLYVADGVRTRDLLPHRPDVCYPAAGWTLESAAPVRVALDDGGSLPATLYVFGRGGLDGRGVTVLSFFVVDGEVHPGVGRLRSAFWQVPNRVQQVQMTCAQDDALDARSREVVTEFARRSGTALLRVLHAGDACEN